MTRLWWVRHGPTHAKTMIGWTDRAADLSDTAALARLQRFLPDAPVVSSDLVRAVTTADAVQHTRPRHPHDPRLREIHFGAWEDVAFAQADASHGPLLRQFWETPGKITAPDGESWNDLRARVDRAADQIVTLGPDVIVVAHMGTILTQVQRATGRTGYETFAQKIDNLSVTRIAFDGAWSIELVNHIV